MSAASCLLEAAPANEETRTLGVTLPLDLLNAPGAYVCNWSGHLLRLRSEAPRPPAINFVGNEPLLVTKISDDPDVALSEAKRLAETMELSTCF